MNTCIVIAAVISCTLSGPKLAPQEAARILMRSIPQDVAPHPRPQVQWIATGASSPTLGPHAFPTERPGRRLDGTLLSDPVQQYGISAVYPVYQVYVPR